MSSDEEDVDLNEDATAQLDNASDDGTDMMEADGRVKLNRGSITAFSTC
jgi:hypothetical protein